MRDNTDTAHGPCPRQERMRTRVYNEIPRYCKIVFKITPPKSEERTWGQIESNLRINPKKHNSNAEQPCNRSRAVYKTGKDANHEFVMKTCAVPKSCWKKRYKSEKRTSEKSKHCPPGAKTTTVPKQRKNFDLIGLPMVFTCLGLFISPVRAPPITTPVVSANLIMVPVQVPRTAIRKSPQATTHWDHVCMATSPNRIPIPCSIFLKRR